MIYGLSPQLRQALKGCGSGPFQRKAPSFSSFAAWLRPCPSNMLLGFRGRRRWGEVFCLGLAAAGRDRRQEQLPGSTRGPEPLPPHPAVLGGPPRAPEERGQAGTTTTTDRFSSFPAFHMQDQVVLHG